MNRCLMVGLLVLGLIQGAPSLARRPDAYPTIESVKVNRSGSMLTLEMDRPLASNTAVSTIRLLNPYRLVVDIPNAALGAPSGRKRINRHGISEIEFSESKGTFYNAVRLTVYTDDFQTLNQIQPVMEGKNFLLTLEPPMGPAPLPNAMISGRMAEKKPSVPVPGAEPVSGELENLLVNLPPERTVIESIYWKNNQLYLQADPSHSPRGIQVKNRFKLKDPNRLVLDIENAVIGSKSLLRPLMLDARGMTQVRMGQFDDQTVRLVIESNTPELLSAVYPGTDKKLMSITQSGAKDIATLPADTPLGQLGDISIVKRGTDTIIRIDTTVSMVPQVTKDGDKVVLELFNIAAQAGTVGYDRHAFPQVAALQLENLNATQPNSKLVVNLADGSDTEVSSQISSDKKLLELVLSPVSPASKTLSKAPFPARVVVDAGHGGKDLGANRDGVFEKNLNLDVALKLKRALEARGVKVYLTRSQDVFLPLAEISAITNNIHPDLFVSVHTNASNNPEVRGLETYYYTRQSIPLARRVHQKMVNMIDSPDRGVRQARYYVIHHTNVPAILCEMGYISQPAERGELQTDARQQKTASAIADGVVEFLKAMVSAKLP